MEDPPWPDEDLPVNGWSDSGFLGLATNGSQDDAYRMLFEHFGRLRGYLSVRYLCELGGSTGVEEIVHEAAWKAVESVRSYSPLKGGVHLWAWTIGVRLAQDRIRSESARRRREQATAKSAQEPVHSKDAQHLREALESLPEPHRTILIFDLEHGGLGPTPELAARLQLEVQTVYNLRRQARKMLADKLR